MFGAWLNTLTAGQIFGYYLLLLVVFQVVLAIFANIHFELASRGYLHKHWSFPKEPKDLGVVNREEALRYDTPIRASVYEMSKRVFMIASGILAMRIVLYVFFFALGIFTLSWFGASGPISSRVVRTCFMLHLWCGGYYIVRQYGTFAPPTEVKLLCVNHIAILEYFTLFAMNCAISVVSRRENIDNIALRSAAKNLQAISVDRNLTDSKRSALVQISERAKSRDPKVLPLLVFPEGTCGNQLCLFKFSKGAFVAGEPLQPILLRFDYKHFNPSWTAWEFDGTDFLDLQLGNLCQFVNKIEIKCLNVYYPSEAEKANPDLFAENVEKLMAMSLGVPRSEATFEYYREVLSACKKSGQTLKFPPRTFITPPSSEPSSIPPSAFEVYQPKTQKKSN
eukprot:c26046_g1_i1.p1 GENE.c26046_g1_i1~~c26046_g1_i1.p1  ORF type:complete len:415 (+),score=77.94 c26046_g1_i1:64-1245(+)